MGLRRIFPKIGKNLTTQPNKTSLLQEGGREVRGNLFHGEKGKMMNRSRSRDQKYLMGCQKVSETDLWLIDTNLVRVSCTSFLDFSLTF